MNSRTNKTSSELNTLMTLAPLVMFSRMTEFWMTAASPTPTSKREVSRMVTEKMQAMGESAVAVNMAMTKVAMDTALAAMTGQARCLESDADDVLAAALKPYSRRVRANQTRLSK